MFCELCGLQYLPKQSVCTRCGAAPTRHWFQLISLVMLTVAITCNSLVALFLLPSLTAGRRGRLLFQVWLWLDEKGAAYGWALIALGLLTWDYFVGRRVKPKVKTWISRKLLLFVLLAGVTPFIPWWIPAGQPPENFLAAIAKHPGLPSILAWASVVFVTVLLCHNAETRDSLLGDGKILSLVSLGILVLVLLMTIVGWATTYQLMAYTR